MKLRDTIVSLEDRITATFEAGEQREILLIMLDLMNTIFLEIQDPKNGSKKQKDQKYVYILYEISIVYPSAVKKGEVYSKEDANSWVGNNSLRCWHEKIMVQNED